MGGGPSCIDSSASAAGSGVADKTSMLEEADTNGSIGSSLGSKYGGGERMSAVSERSCASSTGSAKRLHFAMMEVDDFLDLTDAIPQKGDENMGIGRAPVGGVEIQLNVIDQSA